MNRDLVSTFILRHLIVCGFIVIACIPVEIPNEQDENKNDYPPYPTIVEEDYMPEISPKVFMIYSKNHYREAGPYMIGERTGIDYHITQNCELIVYRNRYLMESEIVKEKWLDEDDCIFLDTLFQSSNFINYPSVVPKRPPRMWLHTSGNIGYRFEYESEMKIITFLHLDRSDHSFPEGFFKIVSGLESIVNNNY